MNLYKIYWRDIQARTEWANLTDSLEWGEKSFWFICVTSGYIIKETNKYILVASSYQYDSHDEEYLFNDVSMIPKSVIVERVKLKSKISQWKQNKKKNRR